IRVFTLAGMAVQLRRNTHKRSLLADRLIGDGLVPLRSALGQHNEARHQLAFLPAHTLIVYRTSHMALLANLRVGQQLLRWLSPLQL
ncbi:hypothetical protein NG896_19715, partial [Aeromonas veronii]|nr:hypothetical protein [Aeromonas veronii]